MYCSHCGKELAENANFCPFCGKPVKAQHSENGLAVLTEKARAGEQNAIAALYEQTYNQVFYTIKSMIRDEDAVFDILQDTYIKAFAHLDRFDGNTKFLPWVKQIAANTARDWLKKKKPILFTEMASDNEQDIPVEEQFVDERGASMPEQVIDQQETTRLIREIIDELPEDQRAVIGMFYYEELSVKQIAVAMGASESAVKSRLMYGRKKIEIKVRELEKKGTKLYGLAPIPFLLLLFRSQKVNAAGMLPNEQILMHVLKNTVGLSDDRTKTKAHETDPKADGTKQKARGTEASAGTAKAAAVKSGKAASAAAGAAGGLGAVKIVCIVLAVVAVIGGGIFGLSHINQEKPEMKPEMKSETELPEAEQEVFGGISSSVSIVESETQSSEIEGQGALEQALMQYENIIAQADTYSYDPFGNTEPTGTYRYALVLLLPDDPVPTLLVSQETKNYLYFVRMFQYVPDSDTILQPEESLMEGVAQAGGYRGGLGMMADGNGICVTEASGGTGDMTISRAKLDGDAVQVTVEWEGNLLDTIPEDLKSQEIEWCDTGDITMLRHWTADEQPSLETAEPTGVSNEGDTSADVSEMAALPQDGDRIVFYGMIDQCSYDEVVRLQGEPDPNSQWADTSQTFRLIVLDEPQTMEVSGEDGLRSGEVRIIDVTHAEGLDAYDGQRLIFSIDPANTWWPGDTSLPLGQPRTRDVKILDEKQ